MTVLEIKRVRVDYDGKPAVLDVTLRVPDGDVLAVLGPSGCGKSTLLRAVAGLEPLAAGTVSWDDEDLSGVPTHRRGFALMFQDGQLFDHLTVARNVAYPLRLRGTTRAAIRSRVDELLELVGLAGYGRRLPRTLSGGERQRVALARSLAAEPRLLLLDEPLSALDAELRTRLAGELRQIIRKAGTTALLVTHDQAEALTISDRIAVMRTGQVVQEGRTAAVWAAPRDRETALFLGYGAVVDERAAAVLLGRDVGGALALRASAVTAVSRASAGNEAEVVEARATPDDVRLILAVEGVGRIPAVAAGAWIPEVGDRVTYVIDDARVAVLPHDNS